MTLKTLRAPTVVPVAAVAAVVAVAASSAVPFADAVTKMTAD